jgi:uracil-DNA glycosylase
MKEYKKLEKIGYSGITLRDIFDKFSSEFESTDFETKVAKIENLIAKGINIELLIYEYIENYDKSSKPYVAKEISWALASLIEFKIGKKTGASYKNSKELLISIFANVFNKKAITDLEIKKIKYENLVAERQIFEYDTEEIVNPYSLELGNDNNLNAWANWHSNLDADIIIIGQDFGSIEYYKKNNGLDESDNETNLNLRNLCLNLNIDLGTVENPNKASIYLTNAVLGAKSGSMSTAIKTKWYDCTKHLTKKLIEIISPKYIITLGAIPLDLMKRIYKLDIENLAKTIENNPITLENGIKLFAVYHCSNLGFANRKKELQIHDWKKINKIINS